MQRLDAMQLKTLLYQQLMQLIEYMEATKTLSTTEQLQDCVDSIVHEFWWMKVEEIVVVFQMIKKGRFGKFYERLKEAEILECLRTYDADERESWAVETAQAWKKENPFDENVEFDAQAFYENGRKLQEELAKQKEEEDAKEKAYREEMAKWLLARREQRKVLEKKGGTKQETHG